MKTPIQYMLLLYIAALTFSYAQENSTTILANDTSSGRFSFGTTVGANYDEGYMSGAISPMLVYNFNDTFGAGIGYNYSKGIKPNEFETTINGGSAIALINILHPIQLSAEFERSNVIINYADNLPNTDEDFWYSALFFGAGITANNIIFGVRYNVFYKDTDNNNGYSTPLVPYVRVLF